MGKRGKNSRLLNFERDYLNSDLAGASSIELFQTKERIIYVFFVTEMGHQNNDKPIIAKPSLYLVYKIKGKRGNPRGRK